MTSGQKQLLIKLLTGEYFLRKRHNRSGGKSYAVYTGNMTLVMKMAVCKELRQLLKEDAKGCFSLNLSSIRQLHGNSWIKQQYKKSKDEKSNN